MTEKREQSLSMLCDFYEFTMANGYFNNKLQDKIVYFEMYFRKTPDGGGFAVSAGLADVIKYVENLSFAEDDIDFLRQKGLFDEEFLTYLKDFKFTGDIYAVPEGTPVFAEEPLVIVRAKSIEAQIIETMVLLTINHQSLIATKANRIVRAAMGRDVLEFGARRAQGYNAAVMGARAAYIGGCVGTSCTLAGKEYGIPVSGTMGHSFITMFTSEYEAFCAYAKQYSDNCILLVDTYNVLKSGIPNAIRVFDEILKPLGKRPKGIRIDSGDIAYLTQKARNMLDAAGYEDCKIIVSNSLDELIIRDALTVQNAKFDIVAVGERLITSKSEPVFGGVYKLVAVEENGEIIPKIKISENVTKITTPHFKKLYRLFERKTNKAIADVICLHDEVIDDTKPYEIFDRDYTWKKKMVTDFYAKEMLQPIFKDGILCYENPDIHEVREYCKEQVETLWDEVLRFENPHNYYVDLSQKLWDVKNDLLKKSSDLF